LRDLLFAFPGTAKSRDNTYIMSPHFRHRISPSPHFPVTAFPPSRNLQPDLIIAATAIHHGLTLVTRDRSDYDMARVPVINPWDAV